MHEPCLSIIHNILWWLLLLLIWIVKSWCSCVRSSAEITLIHLILFVHQYYTVILLVTIACFETSINSSYDRTSTVWELTSCLFIRLIEGVSSAIRCWFSSTTYCCVVSTGSIAVNTLSKIANIHSSIHCILVLEISWTTLDRSLSVVINVYSSIHVLIVTITIPLSIYWHTVFMLLLNWVAGTTVCSLFSELGLSNGFRDLGVVVAVASLIRVLTWWVHARHHLLIVLSRIEELLGSHHHLLVVVLASIRSFTLVYQIKKMSLVTICCNSIRSSNSVAAYSTWIDPKGAGTISITCLSNLVIHLFEWLALMLLSVEIVHILLPSIALSDVFHEVSVVHCISHLCLILVLISSFLRSLRIAKSSNSGLVEHLLFLIHLTIYVGEHLMNPWIISWLKQNTIMSCVHFINAKRSVASGIASSLLSHSVSHEKCLIWFLSAKPIFRKWDK